MSEKKLELMLEAVQCLIEVMPQESFFMVARFGDYYEWLTSAPL